LGSFAAKILQGIWIGSAEVLRFFPMPSHRERLLVQSSLRFAWYVVVVFLYPWTARGSLQTWHHVTPGYSRDRVVTVEQVQDKTSIVQHDPVSVTDGANDRNKQATS
jgi:hypothetical protein